MGTAGGFKDDMGDVVGVSNVNRFSIDWTEMFSGIDPELSVVQFQRSWLAGVLSFSSC